MCDVDGVSTVLYVLYVQSQRYCLELMWSVFAVSTKYEVCECHHLPESEDENMYCPTKHALLCRLRLYIKISCGQKPTLLWWGEGDH